MKCLTEYLKFHTRSHRAYVHITPQVEQIVSKSGVKEGMVLVSAMHITAGVYVNDNESGLIEDIDQWLEKLAPFRKDYKHHDTGEDNGDSHLKALLIHHEVIVPITAGKLDLGTWQRIFYAEFDGQRDKRVIVKVHGRVSSRAFRAEDRRAKRGRRYAALFFSCIRLPMTTGESRFPRSSGNCYSTSLRWHGTTSSQTAPRERTGGGRIWHPHPRRKSWRKPLSLAETPPKPAEAWDPPNRA